MNRFVCFYRALKRFVINKIKKTPHVAEGCPEKFDLSFTKWILYTQPSFENPIAIKIIKQNIAQAELIIFKNSKEIENFKIKFNSSKL